MSRCAIWASPANAYRGLLNREGDATFINTIFTFLTRDEGSGMRICGAYARHQNRSFVVSEDSPVRTIEELKGATLGLFSMDHEEFAEATLQAHGIDPKRDVKFNNYRTTKSYDADKMAAAAQERRDQGDLAARHNLRPAGGGGREGPAVAEQGGRQADAVILGLHHRRRAGEADGRFGAPQPRDRTWHGVRACESDAAIRLTWKYEPRARPAPGEEQRALERDRIGLKVRLQNHGIEDPNKPNLGGVSASEIESWRDFLFDTKAISKKLPVDDYYTTATMVGVNDFDAPALVKRAMEFKI